MRLLTFALARDPGTPTVSRFGALLTNNTIVDLQAAVLAMSGTSSPMFADILSFLDSGTKARQLVDDVFEFVYSNTSNTGDGVFLAQSDVTLLAPLPRPRSLRACTAFEQHMINSRHGALTRRIPLLATLNGVAKRFGRRPILAPPRVWYEHPIYYKGNPFSVVGPSAEVRWPTSSSYLDYELELACVIGKPGRDISAIHARDHIAGYTILNDFSARDILSDELRGNLGPAKGKDFDTGNALGPYLVTNEDISDPYRLSMVARVNGVVWSSGNTRDMHYSFEDMIAYISRDETLYPGEVISSGTVGNGSGIEVGRQLCPNDIVELEIERIGRLSNRVVRA